MKLTNKVAIVTGAASGIGLETANLLLASGAQVVYSDLNEGELKLDNEKAIFIKCDVSDQSAVEALVAATISRFNRLDIMVNNAGIGSLGGVLEVNAEVWHKTIGVNLSGVFYGAQAAAKTMKEKKIKGSIINISSILGTVGFPGAVAYCAAKGGVVQLTRAAALDLAPDGIRINAIAPGFIETNMTKGVLVDDNFNKMIKMNTPLGYVGQPADIAALALYLASDESSYVTGQILHVDGGWTAR